MKNLFALILIGILILSYPHNSHAQTTNPQDTVKQISLQDLREFSTYLASSTSYSDYNKLQPEEILSKLWIWRMKIKK